MVISERRWGLAVPSAVVSLSFQGLDLVVVSGCKAAGCATRVVAPARPAQALVVRKTLRAASKKARAHAPAPATSAGNRREVVEGYSNVM